MGFIKALPLIVAGYVMSCAAATAAELCRAGPFETDARVIAAAMAAQPQKLVPWDASVVSGADERFLLTDGARWAESGGLLATKATELRYDVKRYSVVSVVERWPMSDNLRGRRFKSDGPEPTRRIPNQVIRRVGHHTYTTTIARPTPEQAREFACLANQYVAPPVDKKSRWVCDPGLASDEYEESFSLVSNRSGVVVDTDIPCDTRVDLENRMAEVVSDPIDEVIERGKGTWQFPHVHSVAIDAADNLYLLVDPGTIAPRAIDIRKITPFGSVTRLSAAIDARFSSDAFAVDGRGHVWVPVAERTATAIYDVIPGGDSDSSEQKRLLAASDPRWAHEWIESMAVDLSGTLYAMSGSEILKFTRTGALTLFAESNISQHYEWNGIPDRRSQLTLAPDGTLFVSDSINNIILKVSPNGAVTILAGTPHKTGATDGAGNKALFSSPKGLVLDREGDLYVADSGNQTIRRITPDGGVSTVAGKPGKRATADGQGRAARFDSPASIAIDSGGTLYVASGADNRVRKVSPAGVVSTVNAQQFIDMQ
jgi:hypothetical protein